MPKPCDLLVKLYNLPLVSPALDRVREQDVEIRRALPIDKHLVLAYVGDGFSEMWSSECDGTFSRQPPTCFIAVHGGRIVGFACYNATCWGFFGPLGVDETFRGRGIGTALLLRCLQAMWDDGYAYAVVGWTDEDLLPFYRVAGATVIPDSFPGIYKRMVSM